MFNARSAMDATTPTGEYIQPDLGYALRIWWAFYWPTTLVSSVLGFALGYALRLIYENTAVRAKLILAVSRAGGYLLYYLVAIFVMHYILAKRFRHFRIGLLMHSDVGSQALRRTFKRTLRVWWTYTWRTALYGFVAWIVVALPMGSFVGIFNPGPTVTAIFAGLLGFLLGGGVGLYVIYSSILDEDIGDFHVSLLPLEAGILAPATAVANPMAQ